MGKRVYVTYVQENGHEKKKMLKLDASNFNTMCQQIKHKFSLSSLEKHAFKGKLEEHGPYVELDDMDDDIIDDVIEVKFQKLEMPTDSQWPLSQSPPLLEGLSPGSSKSGSSASLASTVLYTEGVPYSSRSSSSIESSPTSQPGYRELPDSLKCQEVATSSKTRESPTDEHLLQMSSDTPDTSILATAQDSFASPNGPSTSQDAVSKSCVSSGSAKSQIVFDARKILMEHPKGPTIIKEYHKNRYICPGSRMTLVSVLVAHLIAKCGSYPTIEEKHALGRSVITLFPNLSDSSGKTGYEHFFCSAGGQSGYIQDKLKNMRRSLPQSAKLRMKKDTPKPCPKEDLPCKLLPESEAEELESFCRNALGDRNKAAVTKAMAQSAPNRRAWINAEAPFLSLILQRYPRFMDMPELIDQDFKAIFSDPADNLLRKWANHAQMLLTFASTCKQERVVKVHQDFRAQTSRKTEELTALYGFLVLLCLLPSYNTKAKGRVSCEDVDRLLVKFFEVNVPLEEILHDKTTKQPTLVVLGTRSLMEQILLKIEEYGFHLPSINITAAVDLLFKSHYVFNLEYSPQLFNFFLYLQTQIYGLEYTGKLPPRVTEIAMALKAL